jgi:hypothetical protein
LAGEFGGGIVVTSLPKATAGGILERPELKVTCGDVGLSKLDLQSERPRVPLTELWTELTTRSNNQIIACSALNSPSESHPTLLNASTMLDLS